MEKIFLLVITLKLGRIVQLVTILLWNVKIGHCNIGSNVILKNTIVGNNTNILDGAIIGKKVSVSLIQKII